MKSTIRSSVRRRTLVLLLLLFSIFAIEARPRARNVILIIGDGMGIGAVTAARCAGPGAKGQLVLDTMPVTGLVKTHSADKLVTDSAASGTALATGCKTDNGSISVDPGGRVLPTILELAGEMGKSSGVITTDTVTSATPAVFYAHVDSRAREEDIALQLVESQIAVAMGSGRRYFVAGPDGRKDGLDVLARARGNGFDVLLDGPALAAGDGKRLLGLFSFDDAGPTLEAMLAKTIGTLARNRRGFFVMAESCLPDKGGHKNDIALSLRGVNELEDALRYALRFAARDHRTLVVVTADHETGGLAVRDKNPQNPRFTPAWVDGHHTGNMVAVYAYGPGAEKFTGTHDNTDIPKIIASLWGRTLGCADNPPPARSCD